MFYIIIRGRNCADYIAKCLDSLRAQTYSLWRAQVILDAPADDSATRAQWFAAKDGRIQVYVNRRRYGLTFNMVHGIDCAGGVHRKEIWNLGKHDIVGFLDADDWLEAMALMIVHKVYTRNESCWLTYGSYVKESKGRRTKISRPYAPDADVRTAKWHGSHLKTFKYGLYRHLPHQAAFLHEGKWLEAASDLALMFPLMELAGLNRCCHVNELIYHWRDQTPYTTNSELQKDCEWIIRAKPRLERLEWI